MKNRLFLFLPVLLILCSLMVLLSIPASAAANSGDCGNKVSWTFDNASGILTVFGTGEMEDYPLEGAPWYELREAILEVQIKWGVTTIGNSSFYGLEQLTKVVLPSSVTMIGDSAFYECGALTTVVLPNSINTIKYAAFSGCSNLVEITLPKNIQIIADSVFSNCTALDSVKIPDGVSKIGNYAFYGCIALADLQIPENVNSIGDYAFFGCNSLTAVQIHKGVNYIGTGSFSNCKGLTALTVEEGNAAYCNDPDGGLLNLEQTDLLCCPAGLKGWYTIPTTVINICDSAFHGASGLNTVSFSKNGVRTIGRNAFTDCSALRIAILPDSIQSIGAYAFSSCKSLPMITIPSGVEVIQEGTFDSCTALVRVYFSEGITTIEDYAFYGCTLLVGAMLPQTVTSLGWSAFDSCSSLTEFTIPEGVETIGWATFRGCTGLTEINIPESVEEIGYIAFESCSSLTKVVINNPNCSVYDVTTTLGDPQLTTISGPAGAVFEKYAQKYGYKFTTIGSQDEETPTMEELSVKIGHSLNLANDISINYAVSASELSGYTDLYLECIIPTYEGNTQIGTQTFTIQPALVGNYYYFTMNGLTAVQIGDMIDSVLHAKKDDVLYVSATDNYSIATYAYNQLKKSAASESLKKLCANILQYGAKAQVFKGYRTDSLADTQLSEEHKLYLTNLETVTINDYNKTIEDAEAPVIAWVGKTLSLESKVVVRFIVDTTHYTGSPGDLSLQIAYTNVEGQSVTTVLTNPTLIEAEKNWYVFDFAQLGAAELRSILSAKVFAEEQQVSSTIEYSVETYCNGKTGALGDLCKAMLAYSDCAKNFFS